MDVRIVAATNRDLAAAVREKAFREDLFYRLNVLHLHLPPLRDRRQDIPLLANHLWRRHSERQGRYLTGFSVAALDVLCAGSYPGNVRELSNAIEQAVALAAGPIIERHDLPSRLGRAPEAAVDSPPGTAATFKLADLERQLIIDRIRAHNGNLTLVAQEIGISRATLWRRMKEYGIQARPPQG